VIESRRSAIRDAARGPPSGARATSPARKVSEGHAITGGRDISRPPTVELKDVSLRYKGVQALDHVSLSIPAGEFFSLLLPVLKGHPR
jgi:ABC-type multidrug transport system fused ATPase/permease subunit